MPPSETIYALSSGRPPAAVAVIRISGPKAHQAGEAIAGPLPPARTTAVRELREPGSGALLDRALVLRFPSPASATGEDIVEFQCHGGRAVVDSVLSALSGLAGLREAVPGEFTRRAFDNGRIDLTQAEGLADLIEAETDSQRKAALALAEGGLSEQIGLWQEGVLALSARAERAIDYDEDDQPFDSAIMQECEGLAAQLESWLARPRMEPLKHGLKIVIAGPPNAGKSSLLNAIAGFERAIVSATPGTTRDHLDVAFALAGTPVVLTDTAGIRAASDDIEAAGVARSQRLLKAADVLLWLGPSNEAPVHERLILVHPKADLGGGIAAGALPVSSLTGEGLGALLERIAGLARTLLPGEDVIALNRRQATEIGVAAQALRRCAGASDHVLMAEDLRLSRVAFDRLTGRAGVEDLLDALFSRFCLGK